MNKRIPRFLVPAEMDGLYHVVSRVVGKAMVFGEGENNHRKYLALYKNNFGHCFGEPGDDPFRGGQPKVDLQFPDSRGFRLAGDLVALSRELAAQGGELSFQ